MLGGLGNRGLVAKSFIEKTTNGKVSQLDKKHTQGVIRHYNRSQICEKNEGGGT